MYKQLILSAAIFIGGPSTLSLSIPSAAAHSIGRTAEPYCKNAVRGRVGLAVRKSKARDRARRKWAYDVKWKHGYSYTSWQQAKDKDYHCQKKAGTWRCRAHAYPCDWQAH